MASPIGLSEATTHKLLKLSDKLHETERGILTEMREWIDRKLSDDTIFRNFGDYAEMYRNVQDFQRTVDLVSGRIPPSSSAEATKWQEDRDWMVRLRISSTMKTTILN